MILMSAEDSVERILTPRLEVAGADLARCHILPPAESTQQAVEWIEQELEHLPNGGRGTIVGVDPITAFMGNKDPNTVTNVRAALRPFVEMGWRRRVTVIVVHHLTKSLEGRALSGSGGGWDRIGGNAAVQMFSDAKGSVRLAFEKKSRR